MKACENCGSRVYTLGCVNCDEDAYIAEQERLTDCYGEEDGPQISRSHVQADLTPDADDVII